MLMSHNYNQQYKTMETIIGLAVVAVFILVIAGMVFKKTRQPSDRKGGGGSKKNDPQEQERR